MLTTPYLSIVIPAFNEEKIIEENVLALQHYLADYLDKSKSYEIIIVNDGSNDGTGQVIDRMAEAAPGQIIACHHKRNFGRGRGLRTGFVSASGEYVITLDADLSYSPDHIARLMEPLISGQADVTLASAYHTDGAVKNVSWNREFISRMANRLFSISLGGELKTVTCVVRGYTKDVLDALALFSDDKDIHLEIIQKARMIGFRIVEVPAVLSWKNQDRSSKKKGLSFRSFQKMAERHLFFNFLFRPSMLVWFPIAVMSLILIILSIMIVSGYFLVLSQQTPDGGFVRFYLALREHLIYAKLSYFIWGFSLILLFQFLSMVFLAKQSNHHYQELFTFLSYMDRDGSACRNCNDSRIVDLFSTANKHVLDQGRKQ